MHECHGPRRYSPNAFNLCDSLCEHVMCWNLGVWGWITTSDLRWKDCMNCLDSCCFVLEPVGWIIGACRTNVFVRNCTYFVILFRMEKLTQHCQTLINIAIIYISRNRNAQLNSLLQKSIAVYSRSGCIELLHSTFSQINRNYMHSYSPMTTPLDLYKSVIILCSICSHQCSWH